MESVKTERQAMAEQVAALTVAGGKKAVRRGRQIARAMGKALGVAALVALAVVAVRAEMWLLSQESGFLGLGGLFFFGYLFLIGAFGVYCFFFTPQSKVQ